METGMWSYLLGIQQMKLMKDLGKGPNPDDVLQVALKLKSIDDTLDLEKAIELARRTFID